MKLFYLLVLTALVSFHSIAQENAKTIEKKKYQTTKLKSGSITLDSIPIEPKWNAVEWGGGDFGANDHLKVKSLTIKQNLKFYMTKNFYICLPCI
jgi:hypothetical protein